MERVENGIQTLVTRSVFANPEAVASLRNICEDVLKGPCHYEWEPEGAYILFTAYRERKR